MTDQQNLEAALRSHFPIVIIETHEEKRATKLITNIVKRKSDGLLIWTAGEGLQNYLMATGQDFTVEGLNTDDYEVDKPEDPSTDPEEMLKKIKDKIRNNVILLLDFHPYLSNPKVLRLTKELALSYEEKGNKLVMLSHNMNIPADIKRMCMYFELSLPSADEIHQLVVDEAKEWNKKNSNSSVKADREAMKKLVQNLTGLTLSDAKRFIRNAIYDDGAITHSDVKEIMQAKYQLVANNSALTYEYDTVAFSDVGGFKKLKRWLEKRKNYFLNARTEDELDIPKGVMLLGVQGCGKSLAAKSIAGVWGIPLLRFDFGALYNKYVGETEKNIRQALKSAETLSPCVLWIDEIEKGIGSDSDDGGTSRRVLGTLLTWMAENNARVFLVTTANDIKTLPPELIRKGRLDEIFFVDLPDTEARKEIINLHLLKRKMKADDFDLDKVAQICDGFSGAEIEQVVVSARYSAHADEASVNTSHLIEEIELTQPLSVVLAEEIAQLREWARTRTVSAN